MFINNNNNTLFGTKPPQTTPPYQAPPAQQQTTTPNLFGTQTQSNIFGQTAAPPLTTPPMGQSIFGQQQPFGQTTQPPAGQLAFNTQPQNMYAQPQQQPLATGLYQQQPMLGSMTQNPFQQQPNQIQNALNDVNVFKEKFANLQNKLIDIEKEKNAYTQPAQQQQWTSIIQPISQVIQSIDSKTVLDTSQQILVGQKEVAKKLDEYITTVGLVQKITEDGIEALKKEENILNDYQKAQQTMKEAYDQMSGTVRINQTFSVPQKYQEQLIIQQKEQFDSLSNTVEKMIKYYERQPNMEIDEVLQYKMAHLQTLSSYLYMLSLKIRNIAERSNSNIYVATAFQTKVYQQQFPDKKVEEFYTIDTHKEMLDQINAEDI